MFSKLISKNLYGEKVALSEDGDFFYPQKFSIAGRDAYIEYQSSLSGILTPEVATIIKEIKEKYPDMKDDEVMSKMDPIQLASFVKSIPVDSKKLEKLYRIYFKYGVGSNNLNNESKETIGLSEESIDSILLNEELTLLMFNKIQEIQVFSR